ncbi:MAG: TlyA family RNA methyltransferase [Candidatus Margulisbacteria bacterium]|nr:TlyA family RNA methyltransferase [Candidatus Margulisiibacteriota bacterium]
MARPKKKEHPYVGRGGVKLEAALKAFNIEVKGRIALDVGASTGGFTDCLLQHGAAKVYAIDVGYGILDWKLRNDPRVKVLERTNIRYLNVEECGARTADLAVVDVSFISLSKVLPVVYGLLADKAAVIALIKPQFEAKREQVERGGIVRSEEVREEVVRGIKTAAKGGGYRVQGVVESPITGADGNVEYLIYLQKQDTFPDKHQDTKGTVKPMAALAFTSP